MTISMKHALVSVLSYETLDHLYLEIQKNAEHFYGRLHVECILQRNSLCAHKISAFVKVIVSPFYVS